MIDRTRKATALAVLLQAYRRYGRKSFRVDLGGPNHKPLKDAERLGWVWFIDADRCGILPAGHNALADHLPAEPGVPAVRHEPHALVSYQCQACGTIVGQPDDGRELPDNTPCPACRASTVDAAAALQRLEDAA